MSSQVHLLWGLDWIGDCTNRRGRPGGAPARNQAASGLRLHNSSARETSSSWIGRAAARDDAMRAATPLSSSDDQQQNKVLYRVHRYNKLRRQALVSMHPGIAQAARLGSAGRSSSTTARIRIIRLVRLLLRERSERSCLLLSRATRHARSRAPPFPTPSRDLQDLVGAAKILRQTLSCLSGPFRPALGTIHERAHGSWGGERAQIVERKRRRNSRSS